MKDYKSPPKLADRLLSWFCKPELVEGIKGDLYEFWERSSQKGWKSSLNYWFQVINVMRPFALKRAKLLQHNTLTMFQFTLLLSWRSMRNNKLYTLLNISGLSLAIISCLFIALYIMEQKSYDQHWEDVEQIHRVTHYGEQDGKIQDHIRSQVVIGDFLKSDYPEITEVGRVSMYLKRNIAKNGKWIEQDKIGVAEQSFLDLFSFKSLHGDLSTALVDVNTIVLTETVAKKFFDDTDVVGQFILMNDSSRYKVTSVIDDLPKTSHFQYSAFMNNGGIARAKRTWASVACITYVKFAPEKRRKLEFQIYDMIVEHGAKDWRDAYGIEDLEAHLSQPGFVWFVELIPITTIHLESFRKELEISGKGRYLTILQFIGAFLAFIAIFNFINLSTAKASTRVKEISIKRILGSQKKQLLAQFLTEAALYSLLATLVAIVISYLILEDFNQLTDMDYTSPFFNQHQLWRYVIPASLLLGLLAGGYPAYFLSRMKTLNDKQVKQNNLKLFARSFCVSLQFAISAILIFGSIAVLYQLNFLDSKDLGFNAANTFVFHQSHLRLGQSDYEKDPKRILFARELMKSRYFESVSSSSMLPMGSQNGNTNNTYYSIPVTGEKKFSLRNCEADHHFVTALGLKLIEGRDFRANEPEDRRVALITESAAKLLNLENPIGTSITQDWSKESFKIVGIVEDFNYAPLHRKVDPLIIHYDPINDKTIATYEAGKSMEAYQEAERIWNELFPNHHLSSDHLATLHEAHYKEERRMSQILMIGTSLAIFIACLGLFGLSTYATERRKKEIGIRKALGATRKVVTQMLVLGFTRPILSALIIGLPVAYYFIQSWLENFAYRVSIGWEVVLLASLVTFALGILTVGFLSYKSASQNPTENLRYE